MERCPETRGEERTRKGGGGANQIKSTKDHQKYAESSCGTASHKLDNVPSPCMEGFLSRLEEEEERMMLQSSGGRRGDLSILESWEE